MRLDIMSGAHQRRSEVDTLAGYAWLCTTEIEIVNPQMVRQRVDASGQGVALAIDERLAVVSEGSVRRLFDRRR